MRKKPPSYLKLFIKIFIVFSFFSSSLSFKTNAHNKNSHTHSWQSSFKRIHRTCRIFITIGIVVRRTECHSIQFGIGLDAYFAVEFPSRTWSPLSSAGVVWLFPFGCRQCGHPCQFGGITSAVHQVSTSRAVAVV